MDWRKILAAIQSRLVEDWRRAWRWFSVQAMAISAAVLGAWAVFPEDLKALLPSRAVQGLAAALLLIGIVGRVVDQGRRPPPDTSGGEP